MVVAVCSGAAAAGRLGFMAEGGAGTGTVYRIVSSLFSKSDFTNRMYLGVSRRSGRSQDGIHAVWLLKSPSMAILP